MLYRIVDNKVEIRGIDYMVPMKHYYQKKRLFRVENEKSARYLMKQNFIKQLEKEEQEREEREKIVLMHFEDYIDLLFPELKQGENIAVFYKSALYNKFYHNKQELIDYAHFRFCLAGVSVHLSYLSIRF